VKVFRGWKEAKKARYFSLLQAALSIFWLVSHAQYSVRDTNTARAKRPADFSCKALSKKPLGQRLKTWPTACFVP